MKKNILILLLFLTSALLSAQEITQVIRGKITDKDTHGSLPGATIMIFRDSTMIKATTSDQDGYYRLEDIPLGRYTFVISYIGFENYSMPNLIIGSGKEVVLDAGLEEMINQISEVSIVAERNKGESINKMATISCRVFAVEETERYAGSRGDPARMASNFAGVQGADDSRNDVVIRGNSPVGILYRIEDVDIPNPNHFGIAGTAGGPASILNNKYLSNSDFFTGAFPAEYGNGIAGIFDLKMRNGNNEKHEFTGQLGFLGTEVTAEGPISKESNSSYILNYRYSTLDLFKSLKLPIGTNAVPRYQDGAFKLNFPTKKGSISVFGLGGISSIDIRISEQHPDEREMYGQNDRDQYFNSGMGVVGASLSSRIGEKTYSRLTVSHSVEYSHALHKKIYYQYDSTGAILTDNEGYFLLDRLDSVMYYTYIINKTGIRYSVNHKFNAANTIKAGISAEYYTFSFDDHFNMAPDSGWVSRWHDKGSAFLIQPYLQWKWKINEKLTMNSGLHSQFFTLNNSFSGIEPRFGLRYTLKNNQWINFGSGMHSQMQPLYSYYYDRVDGIDGNLENFGMDFFRSTHVVAGYEKVIGANYRIKSEVYYQYLSHIPVSVDSSSFSMINSGSAFSRVFPDSLKSTGTGKNYGLELTIERYFADSYYFMLSGSLYNSLYKGSDGIERNTDFNGNYMMNFVASKEFKIGEYNSLSLGAKVTWAGGKRYGIVDTLQSAKEGDIIYIDDHRNEYRFEDYFRVDAKINFKANRKKTAHEIGLDLINVTNQKNLLKLSYAPFNIDPNEPPIKKEYQLGFLPLFYYRLDF